ncbi:hypothetical protein SH528x_007132 [Novipirellula sp. SH528]|uniref:hypothetical protein n=1 Tax=Novipirellula sp. SH528 TaxID=3454466 RepID=UPI003FA06838
MRAPDRRRRLDTCFDISFRWADKVSDVYIAAIVLMSTNWPNQDESRSSNRFNKLETASN